MPLSQSFFSILGLFEIALRNGIDNHYKVTLTDNEWLINSTTPDGMFSDPVFARGNYETRRKIKSARKNLDKPYTHDRLVSSISFGLWVKLFDRIQFRVGGKTLHKIFVNRPTGTNQKRIYSLLCSLRDFRNRIAHHQPICFSNEHGIDLTNAFEHYETLLMMTRWLGYYPHKYFNRLDNIARIRRKIVRLK